MFAEVFLSLSLISIPIQIGVEKQAKPVANLEVNLLGFKNGQPLENLKKKTNQKGIVLFDIRETKDITFVFRTIYKDIQYLSDLIDGNNISAKIRPLQVYDTKSSDERLNIRERSLFFSWNNNSLGVQDEFVVENNSPFAIIGNPQSFIVSLPLNAHDLKLGIGFNEEEVKFEKNDIQINSPLLPGVTRFVMSYGLETAGAELLFSSNTSLKTQNISLGSDIQKFSPQTLAWKNEPSKIFDDKQISLWSLKNLDAIEFSFNISGLPRIWNFSFFIPFIAFLLLIFVMCLLRRNNSVLTPPFSKENLLRELSELQIIFQKKIISSTEYQSRRLDLLAKIAPFYEGTF